jgi:hypothetical protein
MLEIKIEDIFDSLDKIDKEMSDKDTKIAQLEQRLDKALVQVQLLKEYLSNALNTRGACPVCYIAHDKLNQIIQKDGILQIQHISEDEGMYDK